ncbi:hypothetical protein A2U01_0053057, partial [Trifolium medium]|nr:hypothetical protein [Trifolium medium]
MQNTGVNVVVE